MSAFHGPSRDWNRFTGETVPNLSCLFRKEQNFDLSGGVVASLNLLVKLPDLDGRHQLLVTFHHAALVNEANDELCVFRNQFRRLIFTDDFAIFEENFFFHVAIQAVRDSFYIRGDGDAVIRPDCLDDAVLLAADLVAHALAFHTP